MDKEKKVLLISNQKNFTAILTRQNKYPDSLRKLGYLRLDRKVIPRQTGKPETAPTCYFSDLLFLSDDLSFCVIVFRGNYGKGDPI